MFKCLVSCKSAPLGGHDDRVGYINFRCIQLHAIINTNQPTIPMFNHTILSIVVRDEWPFDKSSNESINDQRVASVQHFSYITSNLNGWNATVPCTHGDGTALQYPSLSKLKSSMWVTLSKSKHFCMKRSSPYVFQGSCCKQRMKPL